MERMLSIDEIVLWERDGKLYVSESWARTITKMTKDGYHYCGTLGIFKIECSYQLNDTSGPVPIDDILKVIKKTRQ